MFYAHWTRKMVFDLIVQLDGCVSACQSVCIISEIPAWFRSHFEYHYIYCLMLFFLLVKRQPPPPNQFSCANVSVLFVVVVCVVDDGASLPLIARTSPINKRTYLLRKGEREKNFVTLQARKKTLLLFLAF